MIDTGEYYDAIKPTSEEADAAWRRIERQPDPDAVFSRSMAESREAARKRLVARGLLAPDQGAPMAPEARRLRNALRDTLQRELNAQAFSCEFHGTFDVDEIAARILREYDVTPRPEEPALVTKEEMSSIIARIDEARLAIANQPLALRTQLRAYFAREGI